MVYFICMDKEVFLHTCPNGHAQRNAAQVAKELPGEILVPEAARRYAGRQTPHAGPGRPTLARCPGCDEEMPTAELREHRVPCLRDRLHKLRCQAFVFRLYPKDPDPYEDFRIDRIDDEQVQF